MKWLKYPIMTIAILAPLFIIAAMIIVLICMSFPMNIILVAVAIWISKSDDIPFWLGWKKEQRQDFLKNWDAMWDGKTHTETRDGERWVVIDSEEQ